MWFSKLKSENFKLFLRGVKILEEKHQKRYRIYFYLGILYYISVESYRNFIQEEWERHTWVPQWVLHCRREHYINNEYNRLKLELPITFSMSNWDPESKMVYHVDTFGNHKYEKIVLPPYTYGSLNSPEAIEKFYKFSVYSLNRNKRNDLDNYLRFKTVTLGDYILGVYYTFNVLTRSFDPFFYKPEYFYRKDQEELFVNLQSPNKPETILRIMENLERQLKRWFNL